MKIHPAPVSLRGGIWKPWPSHFFNERFGRFSSFLQMCSDGKVTDDTHSNSDFTLSQKAILSAILNGRKSVNYCQVTRRYVFKKYQDHCYHPSEMVVNMFWRFPKTRGRIFGILIATWLYEHLNCKFISDD
jgi:hypothetical protein